MLKCLLAPAAFLYKAGVTFRHRLFDWGILKSEKFDIPIICIGNITVGGTGKTPMAEMVIAYMSQMHNVALLSRGYGRRTKGYLEVRADSHYRDAGDEPLQIKLKFPDTVVAVCEKRSEGIRRICAEHPEVDLIVMDDGFQHRYVEPKINIVMIDATRPVRLGKVHHQGDGINRRRQRQFVPNGRNLIQRETQTVHAGIELEINRHPNRQGRFTNHSQLLDAMNRRNQPIFGTGFQILRFEESFKEDDRMIKTGIAEHDGVGQIKQRESVHNVVKRLRRTQETVPISIGLHDGQDFRCLPVNGGMLLGKPVVVA